MWKYLARRVVFMMFTMVFISLVTFAIIQLPPGDFVTNLVSQMISSGAGEVSPEFEASMRRLYGLDQPVYIQYFKWLRNIFTKGEFGYSFIYRRDAVDLILERMPLTLALSVSSLLFVWVTAFPIGIYSAVKQYSWGDYVVTFLGFLGMATPNFILALIFMYISYRYFGKATIGLFSPELADAPWSLAKFVDLLKHLWIPMIIVGTAGTAGLIRTMRANLLDELNKPYVETARAKGLSETRLLLKYPVRHALNPFVSTIGLALPGLISGAALTAIVLNLPTAGPVLLTAQLSQDLYVAASFFLAISALTLIGLLISDLLLAWLDPRIRLE